MILSYEDLLFLCPITILLWSGNMACNRALLNSVLHVSRTNPDPEATESPLVAELVLFHPSHFLHFLSVQADPAFRSGGGLARTARLQIFQGLCLKAVHTARVQGFISPETSLQILLCQPLASSVNSGTGNYLIHSCFPKSHLMLIEIMQPCLL